MLRPKTLVTSVFLVPLVRLGRLLRSQRVFGFAGVAVLLLISIVGNALCFYYFDKPLHKDLTFADGLWYSMISITTIGYGDYSASSAGARIGTVIFIVIIGLSAFSAFFGMLIDSMATRFTAKEQGLSDAMAKDHMLIVHFPSEARVRQIIDEIRNDPADPGGEIVIISNQIRELPFDLDGVLFVRGSSHDRATYEQAHIETACRAIVLSRDYGDTDSDAVVAAAAGVIESMNPEIRIAVECLDDRHRGLFQAVRSDAIVSGLRIAGNLMVQDMHDPGITKMIDTMTSSQGRAVSLHSAQVGEPVDDERAGQRTYGQLAKALLDRGLTVMGVSRDGQSHFDYAQLTPTPDDRLVYLGTKRHTWAEMLELSRAADE